LEKTSKTIKSSHKRLKIILGTGVCGRVWFLQGTSRAFSGAGRAEGVLFCRWHRNENLPRACLPPISELQAGEWCPLFCKRRDVPVWHLCVFCLPSCQSKYTDGGLISCLSILVWFLEI